jgi:FkbM family methyltransferase
MSQRLLLRGAAALCRRVRSFPGRWRLVRRVLRAVRAHGHELGSTVVTTHHGFRIRCDLEDWVAQYVYATGTYEERTTDLVTRLVHPGATVVDVGANIGVFTLLLSRLAGPHGRVHAFEPMPVAIARLRGNLALNRVTNVVVHEAAASEASGEAPLFLGPASHTSIASLGEMDGAERVAVRCTSLDEALAGCGPLELIKIDAEGAEPRIITGAMRLVSEGQAPQIIAEVSEPGWPSRLMKLGYEMYWIDWGGLVRVDDPVHPGLPGQFNAFFTQRGLPPGVAAGRLD